MQKLDKKQILTEPPGPRRVLLALASVDANYADVAVNCNCHKSVISRVAAGVNTTKLHARIRALIAQLTDFKESWLFETDSPATEQLSTVDHKPQAA